MDRVAKALQELAAALEAGSMWGEVSLRPRRGSAEWPYIPQPSLASLAERLGAEAQRSVSGNRVQTEMHLRSESLEVHAFGVLRPMTLEERKAEIERMSAELDAAEKGAA